MIIPEPSNLTEAARKRVEKATEHLTKQCCVVTNAPELYSVEYAHILPQSTSAQMLEKLEYSWGMRFGTLNVDTRYNIIRLNSVLHTFFDNGQWILLPEEAILDNLFNCHERPDKSVMNFVREPATYQYTFIPSRHLRPFEIRRYSAAMDTRQTASPGSFDPSYYYPFDTLPTISSHVHPHFVIYHIGLKMQKHGFSFYGPDAEIVQSHRRMIEKAINIFDKWTQDIPAESNFYREPFNAAADDDENDSAFTEEARMDTRACRPSHDTRQPETPSHMSTHSRKRARGPEDTSGLWIDDEALRILDDDSSLRSRLKRQKQSVSAWISSISEVQFDAE